MPSAPGVFTDPSMVTQTNPLGCFWDELPSKGARRCRPEGQLGGPPVSQLGGGGAPCPTPTSNEEALITERMRTYPDKHPGLSSVRNAAATGCPAIVHSQMDSDQWKSTTQATINEHQPTFRKGREGKKVCSALYGESELYTAPRPRFVEPPGAPPTVVRDMRVFKHMGTLSKSGHW